MAASILSSFDGVKTKKKSKDEIEHIHYTKIKECAKNRDIGSDDHIKLLAEDIALDGLDDNLVVRKIDDEDYEYEIIAGHRRYNAIKYNISQGDTTYEFIPCKVKELNDIDGYKRNILNNMLSKPLTPIEKLRAIEDLKEIYRTKKANGEKLGDRIQNLIAADTGLKKSQVGNYEKIIKNAIPEVRELIEKEEITISEATELASLNDENQMMFLEDNEGNISIDTIKAFKEELEEKATADEIDPYENIEDIDYESQSNNHNQDFDYDDEEDDFDYEEESFEQIQLNTKDENSSLDLQSIVDILDNTYEMLGKKIHGIEWREEQMIVDEMKNLLDDFKNMAGLD